MKLVALIASAPLVSGFVQTTRGTTNTRLSTQMVLEEPKLNRRQILSTGLTFAGASAISGLISVANAPPAYADGPYFVPDLPYPYEALEPHIDAATMKFHHDKHHLAYVTNANKAVAGKPAQPILDIQKDAIKTGVRNAGGGHYNHALFWTILAPASESGAPSSALASAIDEAFGSVDKMKEEFNAAAAGVFGSGWAWLGVTPEGKLAITTTPNQDNPLMDGGAKVPMVPILGLDVWEHAYYLKYQNRRPEYISSFWNVVNWPKVSEYYENYASKGKGVPFDC